MNQDQTKTDGLAPASSTPLLACPACNNTGKLIRLSFLSADGQSVQYTEEAGCINMRCILYGRTFPLCVWNRKANTQAEPRPGQQPKL